ncbi:MAG: hypothetical protein HYY31_00035 [Chloroflexi bacterium]|nr:hypothetical protein [Chloroflexota bacterium]
MATVKTVLGEIPPKEMGITFCHEHLILTWPAAKDDRPDDYSVRKLANQASNHLKPTVTEFGLKTLIDVSPWQLGRDVELQQLVARQLDINVVAATGFYRQEAGMADYWLYQELDAFEEFMLREITEGVGSQKVKCGVIKIAWSFNSGGVPRPGEEKATRAAGRASKRTGCPIVAHCSWRGARPGQNMGLEQVQMLSQEGADPERIQISHNAGAPLAFLIDIARSGAYVAFDSPMMAGYLGDQGQLLAATIGGLIRAGYGDKVLLGLDHQGTWFPHIPPGPARDWVPDFSVIHREVLPRLKAGGVTQREINRVLVTNPARLYAW